MDDFEKLHDEDQKNVRLWKKNYSDKEFYSLNKNIRKRLQKLIGRSKKLSPRENFICALILHHGFNLSSSKKALRYIKTAQGQGYKKQKWLIASIKDRLLQLQGKPQKYGTQAVKLKNGKFKQYRIDGTISDGERKILGLPRLKELKGYLER